MRINSAKLAAASIGCWSEGAMPGENVQPQQKEIRGLSSKSWEITQSVSLARIECCSEYGLMFMVYKVFCSFEYGGMPSKINSRSLRL